MENSSRDKLAWTAAKLFQERGYDGVGLNEILVAAELPKGSLYHHFPNGKPDLALGAAALAHREMTRIIDESFVDANTYQDGATTLLFKLAKLFELMGKYTGCPISEILFGGPNREEFREKSGEYFDAWMKQFAEHAKRLGTSEAVAEAESKRLFLSLQGGWTLARAQQDGNVLRGLPDLLFGTAK